MRELLLAIYIDGSVVERRHVVAAIGVGQAGRKHLLGLTCGAAENARVVEDLLGSLVERGVRADRPYLFVIEGAEARRAAIEALFSKDTPVRRCRTHEVRMRTWRCGGQQPGTGWRLPGA